MNVTSNTIMEFLVSAILELKDIEAEDITRDASLEAIALDSLDYVDIQVNIQKTYKVALHSDLFLSKRITTLGELADYIETEYLAANGTVPVAEAIPE